jgi:hypothetical protein
MTENNNGVLKQIRLRQDAIDVLNKYPGKTPSERILQMESKINLLNDLIDKFSSKR